MHMAKNSNISFVTNSWALVSSHQIGSVVTSAGTRAPLLGILHLKKHWIDGSDREEVWAA